MTRVDQKRGGVYIVSGVQVLNTEKSYPEGTKSYKFQKPRRRALAPDHDSEAQLSFEYQSFYMTYIPDSSDKINVEHDQRNLADLKSSFPGVPNDELARIWENSTSWVHCFDILSSIATQNKAVIITAAQFDMMSDSHHWPVLARDVTFVDYFAGMSVEDRDGWTLCSQLNKPNNDDSSTASDDWELVDSATPDNPVTDTDKANASSQAAPDAIPGVVSYRDVVLRNLANVTTKAKQSFPVGDGDKNKVWTPRFVLDDPPAPGVNKRAATEDAVFNEYDEDWASHSEYYGSKSAAIAARVHSVHVRNALKRINVDKLKTLRCKY